jgi:uncharacterized protein YacL
MSDIYIGIYPKYYQPNKRLRRHELKIMNHIDDEDFDWRIIGYDWSYLIEVDIETIDIKTVNYLISTILPVSATIPCELKISFKKNVKRTINKLDITTIAIHSIGVIGGSFLVCFIFLKIVNLFLVILIFFFRMSCILFFKEVDTHFKKKYYNNFCYVFFFGRFGDFFEETNDRQN